MEAFAFTDRCRPICQIGIGDTRVDTGTAVWSDGVTGARWDTPTAVWSGSEPQWIDVTCDVRSMRCEYGRQRTTERFVPGTALVVVDNNSGWADINSSPSEPFVLGMRPGRAIRFGVEHETLGICWRFRGFIDAVTPTYLPADADTVALSCLDALGEVNRAKFLPLAAPDFLGDDAATRAARILDRALWPAAKRDLQMAGVTLIAHDLGGQAADLLGQAADSAGGAVFGDLDARVAFRPRDWQAFVPGTPPDATIGNVEVTDVCPVEWDRPMQRADLATRAIMGRAPDDAVVVDDAPAQLLYGVEPFERLDLLTERNGELTNLANRALRTRGADVSPRIRSVSLDAATATNALDLMATVDVYTPSRYRCRLRYPRGDIFDAEHFATAVVHEFTPERWSLELNLDLAAPYAAAGGRWEPFNGTVWNGATWVGPVPLLAQARALRADLIGASS